MVIYWWSGEYIRDNDSLSQPVDHLKPVVSEGLNPTNLARVEFKLLVEIL